MKSEPNVSSSMMEWRLGGGGLKRQIIGEKRGIEMKGQTKDQVKEGSRGGI